MPSFVIVEKCDGCKALDRTACQYICPNDLMILEPEPRPDGTKKAYNQEPDQCWECFNCVKICPQQAIEIRHYSDFMKSVIIPTLRRWVRAPFRCAAPIPSCGPSSSGMARP